jgi:hypothetical protein
MASQVDVLLGLTGEDGAAQHEPPPQPPGLADAAAEEDPFLASAGLLPNAAAGIDRPENAPGAGAGAGAGAEAEAAVSAALGDGAVPARRETDPWLEDSDSELESDLVFVHVMTRRSRSLAGVSSSLVPNQPEDKPPGRSERAERSSTAMGAFHGEAEGPDATAEAKGKAESDVAVGKLLDLHRDFREGSAPLQTAGAAGRPDSNGASSVPVCQIIDDGRAAAVTPGAGSGTLDAAMQPERCSLGAGHSYTEQAHQGTAEERSVDSLAGHGIKEGVTQTSTAQDAAADDGAASTSEPAGEHGPRLGPSRSLRKRPKPSAKAVAAIWELLEKSIGRPESLQQGQYPR